MDRLVLEGVPRSSAKKCEESVAELLQDQMVQFAHEFEMNVARALLEAAMSLVENANEINPNKQRFRFSIVQTDILNKVTARLARALDAPQNGKVTT